MRVVEPQHFQHKQTSKKKPKKRIGLIFAAIVIPLFLYFLTTNDHAVSDTVVSEQTNPPAQDDVSVNESVQEPAVAGESTLRQFSDNEFRLFYDNLNQPNLTRVENPPVITGNDIADARIRKLAEDRGYKLRSSPTAELSSVDGQAIQPPVVAAWKQLQAEAAKNGYQMTVVSGYRSVENQRALFLQRLSAAGASTQAVAEGTADDIVNKVLITSSIPGYSKHHTAYTIDILCAGYEFENFKNSPCNEWLIKDNYKEAKEAGFIPSYPPTADSQGPDPEAWEYVYVGTELLYH